MSAKSAGRARITMVATALQAAEIRDRARACGETVSKYCVRVVTTNFTADPIPEAAALAELLGTLAVIRTTEPTESRLVKMLQTSIDRLIESFVERLR